MKYYIISLISTLLLSCSSGNKQERDFLGSISKNPCIEYCDVYDLHIYSDGTYVYVGGVNSIIAGTHEGKLSKKELIKIKRLFSELPKKSSHSIDGDIPTISIKHNKIITIHKFESPNFINFHSFVARLHYKIP